MSIIKSCEDSNKRMMVLEKKSGLKYLVDTGATLSVFPLKCLQEEERREKGEKQLFVANGGHMNTYGYIELEDLNFGTEEMFSWKFTVVDIDHPIMGYDFLYHYNLVVDARNARLFRTEYLLNLMDADTLDLNDKNTSDTDDTDEDVSEMEEDDVSEEEKENVSEEEETSEP